MAGKYGRWGMALVLLLGLLVPSVAQAGPYIGEWGWWWHPAPNCPPGEYSWLHYWAMRVYRFRAWAHPSNLDQYPPGVCPPLPAPLFANRWRCQSKLPVPSGPYAIPEGFYGQPTFAEGDAFQRAVNLGRAAPPTGPTLSYPSPGQIPTPR